MPAELPPPADFFDAVLDVVVGLRCLTVPPALGATLLPGLLAAPTEVELAGTGIFVFS